MSTQWKWFVYIIQCKDDLYYTGVTWNISQRMQQHMSGKGSAFTAEHGFKKLCYVEEFENIHEARKREVQIKDYSRKKKEKLWEKLKL